MNIDLRGAAIGDQATADHLVDRIEGVMLRRMQMNDMLGH